MTSLNGIRILLAEDELIVAMQVAKDLADAGCVVLGPFKSVDRALGAIGDEPVDIGLLDVNLGGKWVYPCAEALAHKRVPFVFTTGYERATLPAKYVDRPVMRKPYARDELVSVVSETMGHHRRHGLCRALGITDGTPLSLSQGSAR